LFRHHEKSQGLSRRDGWLKPWLPLTGVVLQMQMPG
jgi:hypothetical protein